jgi:hypothetical protein
VIQQLAVIVACAATFLTFDLRSADSMASALNNQKYDPVVMSKGDAATRFSILRFAFPVDNVDGQKCFVDVVVCQCCCV